LRQIGKLQVFLSERFADSNSELKLSRILTKQADVSTELNERKGAILKETTPDRCLNRSE